MSPDPLHHLPAPGFRGLCWSGDTNRGRVRPNNEDSFVGLQFDAQELHYLGKVGEASSAHTDFVFAVSDGMGGALAGEFASRITVEKVTRLMPRAYQQSASGLDVGYPDVLAELFTQVHRALTFVGNSYDECRGMQATLTLCWFTPGWMYFGHIGDSRLYYLPVEGKELRQLTHDDTHVGWLYRTGVINEREAREHPRRTALQKALGAGNQFVDPQVGAVACEPGDRFLLCSDGLVDGLYHRQLHEMLLMPENPRSLSRAETMVRAAVENSGRDNTTALIIEIK